MKRFLCRLCVWLFAAELQRVEYESDRQIAEKSLEAAKVLLLMLLNDRTPMDQFDLTGPFDFSDQIAPLDEARQTALDNCPDWKAALQSIGKVKTDCRLAVADGSTDPTPRGWYTSNPSFNNRYNHQTLSASISIPPTFSTATRKKRSGRSWTWTAEQN